MIRPIYIYLYRYRGEPRYVGQTPNVENRDRVHCRSTKSSFERFLAREGREKFTLEIVGQVEDVPNGKFAAALEIEMMDKFGTYRPGEIGFNHGRFIGNLTEAKFTAQYAAQRAGLKEAMSRPEVKAHILKAARDRWTPEFKERMKEVNARPEIRARRKEAMQRNRTRRIAALRETNRLLEVKARRSAAAKECQNRLEVRVRKSEVQKEVQNRPEVKARKIAAFNRPEVKARIREQQREVQNRPEVKARHRDAMNRPEVKARMREKIKEALNRPDVKERHRIAVKEAQNRPEVKARKSEASKGRPSWIKGKKHTDETREKMRLGQIALQTPEHRAHLSRVLKGRLKSEEGRLNIAAANRSEKRRAEVSAQFKGKPKSEQTRIAMSRHQQVKNGFEFFDCWESQHLLAPAA